MECKICGSTRTVFALNYEPSETIAEERWTTNVCEKCWDIIAAIAVRAVMDRLEVFAGQIRRKKS